MILVAEHFNKDLSTLPQHIDLFKEGEKGEVRIYLEEPIRQEELDQIRQDLAGMSVKYDNRILLVEFKRQSDPLSVIVLSVGVGILGWQLFKGEGTVMTVGIIVALVGIACVAILSSKRRI